MVTHRGSCHCGRVAFEVDAPADLTVDECNCSICTESGFLGVSVPADQFILVQGADSLSTYIFGSGVAKHTFCKICGIKSFYVPRSHPDGFNINVRCLDPGTVNNMDIAVFDGRHWEEQYPDGRASGYSNY